MNDYQGLYIESLIIYYILNIVLTTLTIIEEFYMDKKVFLGGTCNNSKWRDNIIPSLKIKYFNPVVDNWAPDDQVEELRQREECDICLYVITPEMTGVYSIAEAVDDSNKHPGKTVFTFLRSYGNAVFTPAQYKSIKSVADMVERNGGKCFSTLKETADYLNNA